MIYRRHTLFDQGLNCIAMLLMGIVNAPFILRELRMKLTPLLLFGCVLMLFLDYRHKQKRSKEDIERERRDERAQMILEKSIWYCRQAEDLLLLILYAVLGLCFQEDEIAYTLFWFMIGRSLLTCAIRWWLNRKF